MCQLLVIVNADIVTDSNTMVDVLFTSLVITFFELLQYRKQNKLLCGQTLHRTKLCSGGGGGVSHGSRLFRILSTLTPKVEQKETEKSKEGHVKMKADTEYAYTF